MRGKVIAGLTVGAVVVPQSMSYAILASLTAEYGLYSSFIGVFIYCFFATSKDVTIGVCVPPLPLSAPPPLRSSPSPLLPRTESI